MVPSPPKNCKPPALDDAPLVSFGDLLLSSPRSLPVGPLSFGRSLFLSSPFQVLRRCSLRLLSPLCPFVASPSLVLLFFFRTANPSHLFISMPQSHPSPPSPYFLYFIFLRSFGTSVSLGGLSISPLTYSISQVDFLLLLSLLRHELIHMLNR